MRAFDQICSQPWVITPDMLRTILDVAARENTPAMVDLARAMREERLSRQAVIFADGRPLDGTRSIMVRDGVAIQLIEGPIFRRANMFTELSGATSLETVAKDFQVALDSPAVQSILFVYDSPGGEVTGINEFAAAIYAARGRKPMVAYIEGTGASAAYWLASAAETIVADATAIVGSIGVVLAVPDPGKTNSKEITIISSQSPNKRPDVTTETGKSQLQTLADDTAEVFVSSVALYKDVSVETVLRDFGGGGVFVGQAAVAAGLVDRLGSFASVLAELQAKATGPARFRATTEGRMSWKSMWKDMFGAMAEYEQEVAQANPDTPVQAGRDTGAPAEAVPATADQGLIVAADEAAALRQQLAAERAARFKAEAEAFADRNLAAGKLLPAQRDALVVAYVQAATDDAQIGGTARVSAIAGLIDAQPAHGLTQELVTATSDLSVLANKTSDDKTLSNERKQRLMNMTPLGQSVLNGKRGG